MDSQDDGCIRNTAQSWTRGRLGPSYAKAPDPCQDCGHDETDHAWPLDPTLTPADHAALAKSTVRPCLVATRWPPGTTRQECRLASCACRKHVPHDTHRSRYGSAEGRRRQAAEKAATAHDASVLPAYARRKYRGPMAWEAEPLAARDRTHVRTREAP